MSLSGKVALITGSGRNIGKTTALEFARRGADVVVNARTNVREAETVAQEARNMGVRAIAVIADVGDETQAVRMVEKALSEFGRVDILINNAGLRQNRPLTELSTLEWRQVQAVNLDGPFFLSRAVVPCMISNKGGRIINVAGLNAFRGRTEWAHVCSSKMGAIGLTRALALELAPYGILVNHLVPGAFETIRDKSEYTSAVISQIKSRIPLGRLGLPQEVANLCAFLSSEEAGFITGQTIHINGGSLTA